MTLKTQFDSFLTEKERDLVAQAAQFAATHLSAGTQSVPSTERRALLKLASTEGLAGMEVPSRYGGCGGTFSVRVRVCEELARHDAAFSFALVNHHNVASRIANSAQESIKQKLLPQMLSGKTFSCTAMTEPQSGSDFVAMQTHAVPVEGGWILNGAKAWITNAAFADVFLVYAQTDTTLGAKGIAGFIVLSEDAGFARTDPYDAPTVQAMEVGGFTLRDCFVSDDRVIYPAPSGFMAAMNGVNHARIHVAAMNAGMIEQSLHTTLTYGESHTAFGKPVLDYQGLKWSLADVNTDLTALRLMLYTAAQAIDSGQDAQNIAAMSKKYANDKALHAISQCMQAMGAEGLRDQYPLTRHLNCARAFCYTDGTPEMMNERISYLMRKPFRTNN